MAAGPCGGPRSIHPPSGNRQARESCPPVSLPGAGADPDLPLARARHKRGDARSLVADDRLRDGTCSNLESLLPEEITPRKENIQNGCQSHTGESENKIDGFSVERLMTFLLALGQDVEIHVKSRKPSRSAAKISVQAS